jgi:hypothetical protein
MRERHPSEQGSASGQRQVDHGRERHRDSMALGSATSRSAGKGSATCAVPKARRLAASHAVADPAAVAAVSDWSPSLGGRDNPTGCDGDYGVTCRFVQNRTLSPTGEVRGDDA